MDTSSICSFYEARGHAVADVSIIGTPAWRPSRHEGILFQSSNVRRRRGFGGARPTPHTPDMTFGILLGAALLLLIVAVALSIAQAWAIDGARRVLRHLLVWALASAAVPSLYTWGGVWNWPISAALLAFGTPAALFGMALALGARRDRVKGLAGKPWAQRVKGLTGPHLIVVFLGGAVVLVAGLLAVLSRIH